MSATGSKTDMPETLGSSYFGPEAAISGRRSVCWCRAISTIILTSAALLKGSPAIPSAEEVPGVNDLWSPSILNHFLS